MFLRSVEGRLLYEYRFDENVLFLSNLLLRYVESVGASAWADFFSLVDSTLIVLLSQSLLMFSECSALFFEGFSKCSSIAESRFIVIMLPVSRLLQVVSSVSLIFLTGLSSHTDSLLAIFLYSLCTRSVISWHVCTFNFVKPMSRLSINVDGLEFILVPSFKLKTGYLYDLKGSLYGHRVW